MAEFSEEQFLRERGVDVEAVLASQERHFPEERFIPEARRRIVPPPWRVVDLQENGGRYTDGKRTVITSVARELDGHHWLHVSIARADQIPDYRDLCELKRIWVGGNRKAIQIFPPESEHVNLHPRCLHLWVCLSGDPLPDFTRGLKSI